MNDQDSKSTPPRRKIVGGGARPDAPQRREPPRREEPAPSAPRADAAGGRSEGGQPGRREGGGGRGGERFERRGPPPRGAGRGGPPGRGPRPAGGPAKARPARKLGANDPEKLERRAKAQALAAEKGIPLAHAHRILQGKATLNEVLKTLMRKDRFERLVRHEGLERSLAGQVASGHLSKERAQLVTRIRRSRKHPLDMDATKRAEVDRAHVAMSVFGRGWVTGRVVNARIYDFDFQPDGGAALETLLKHDVKLMAAAHDLEAARAASTQDEAIVAEGLGGTTDRKERVRPADEALLDRLEAGTPVKLLLRDGHAVEGTVCSFGRWDVDLALGGEAVVTVLFHALHRGSDLAR